MSSTTGRGAVTLIADRKQKGRPENPPPRLLLLRLNGADLGEMRFIGRLAPCSTGQNVTDGPRRDVEAARYLGRA
jgi:hypothetical protein